jgi:predicted AAA+ superfamily ATPase
MPKKFNITGNCTPKRHFMADTRAKLSKVIALVDSGEYFTMNRPRQFGKTTTLFTLYNHLLVSEDFFAFKISFEGVGDEVFRTEISFAKMVFEQKKMQKVKKL